jgi:phosphatidylinositol 4-kinase
MNGGDAVTNSYVETGLRSFTDEEKRLVSISTVCVVSTLALEFKKEEVCLRFMLWSFLIWPQVTRLTISMLLQYLRTAEASVEAAIAWNLVHLALVAPKSAFVDILRAFCTINGTDTTGDDYALNSMVGGFRQLWSSFR